MIRNSSTLNLKIGPEFSGSASRFILFAVAQSIYTTEIMDASMNLTEFEKGLAANPMDRDRPYVWLSFVAGITFATGFGTTRLLNRAFMIKPSIGSNFRNNTVNQITWRY